MPTYGIQVTPSDQIKALEKIGCKSAIQEIKRNHDRPLSPARLHHHIELAIKAGLVSRVAALAEISGKSFTTQQVHRLTKRCLRLNWVVDALCAAKLGMISDQLRDELVAALISNQLAENQNEALQLLQESE